MLPLMFKRNSARRGTVACYHDKDGRMVLNLDPDSDPDAVRAIELENLQENMRLLYVALTRAEYSCYLYWGLVSGQNEPGKSGQSALDRLFPKLRGEDWRNLDWKDRPPQLKNVDIQFLYPDDLPVTQLHPEAQQQEKLSCREWNGSIDPNFHFTSFSSLAGKNGGSDEFDYDSDDSGNRLEEPEGIFRIAGGAQTGNAWHKILEEIDFASFDPKKDRDLIEQKMKAFGVLNRKLKQETREEYVELTARMIRHVLDTPLQDAKGEKFSLKDISRNDRLSELKFNYGFHDRVDTGPLPESLSDYIRKFNAGGSLLAIRNRSFSGGYLNGAIDLLFRHDGKLYIADWKSNRINGQVTGFSQDGMAAEMMEHVYYLQYLIYTVAVMKYLAQHLHPQQSLTEAEYEQYFGGVFYFFMRGVDSNVPGQGVFFDRPPFSVIQKLEKSIG
jgi:exodeoxyribonuclease V beta subunit